MLPILFLLIYMGGKLVFAMLIGLVCIVSLREFYRISSAAAEMPMDRDPVGWIGYIAGCLIIWAAYSKDERLMLAIVAINLIIVSVLSFPLYKSKPAILESIFKQSLGLVYIPLLLSHFIFIRHQTDGMIWIFMLLSIIFAGDIGAYYAGTAIGRHKLCPAVSPNKTWEGSIGGLAANIAIGSIFKFYLLPDLSWRLGLLLFAVIGIAGQVGDLFESELKRTAKVKDSGVIFPGHGGMLDRIDAAMFAAPAAYYYKSIFAIS